MTDPDTDASTPGWINEDGRPAPTDVRDVDDNARAADVLRDLMAGQHVRWTGDWPNGRRFLGVLKDRLERRLPRTTASDAATRWREERDRTGQIAEVLGRLLVQVEPEGTVDLRRAQDTTSAVQHAWGLAARPRLVALRTLLGALSAEGWREAGLEIPQLHGRLTPAYGVFSPTRHTYLDLLEVVDLRGRTVLDVGCGTGVIGFIALQRGASRVTAVDNDPRAIACAMLNAQRLGLSARYDAVLGDLFPSDATWDRVIFNAPWMPEPPRTRLDRAVFDNDGETLRRWLAGLAAHLPDHGEAFLIVSDLPERLGLRSQQAIPELVAAAGLDLQGRTGLLANHKRSRDTDDPLHVARSREQVVLWRITR